MGSRPLLILYYWRLSLSTTVLYLLSFVAAPEGKERAAKREFEWELRNERGFLEVQLQGVAANAKGRDWQFMTVAME